MPLYSPFLPSSFNIPKIFLFSVKNHIFWEMVLLHSFWYLLIWWLSLFCGFSFQSQNWPGNWLFERMATWKEGTYFGLIFFMVIGISFPFVAYFLTHDHQTSVSYSTTLGMTKSLESRITNHTESPATTISTETIPEAFCLYSLWKNDGFCDDLTNVQDCDYDGGDCCLVPSLGHYCDNCTCHETLESHVTTTLEPPSKFFFVRLIRVCHIIMGMSWYQGFVKSIWICQINKGMSPIFQINVPLPMLSMFKMDTVMMTIITETVILMEGIVA